MACAVATPTRSPSLSTTGMFVKPVRMITSMASLTESVSRNVAADGPIMSAAQTYGGRFGSRCAPRKIAATLVAVLAATTSSANVGCRSNREIDATTLRYAAGAVDGVSTRMTSRAGSPSGESLMPSTEVATATSVRSRSASRAWGMATPGAMTVGARASRSRMACTAAAESKDGSRADSNPTRASNSLPPSAILVWQRTSSSVKTAAASSVWGAAGVEDVAFSFMGTKRKATPPESKGKLGNGGLAGWIDGGEEGGVGWRA